MINLHFQNKENRDKKFKELKDSGLNVVKRSISNQQIHPQYVEDFPDLSIKADNGFSNTHYKTHFPKLYSIEGR